MATSDRAELDLLATQIRHHEDAYRRGDPEITDGAFDDLVERYGLLAERLGVAAELRLDRRPGVDHTAGFVQVAHRSPMLSLEKLVPGGPTPPDAQLRAWAEKRRAELGLGPTEPLALSVEPKVDGIGIALHYRAGSLVRALTRGDGARGDDVTAQIRALGVVPATLGGAPGELEVRGEIYWPTAAFTDHNAALVAAGEAPLKNPRNGTAGVVKRKDPRGLGALGLRAFVYQVPYASEVSVPRRHGALLAWLRAAGLPVYLEHVDACATPDEAVEACLRWTPARRASLPFEIDGLVVRVDALDRAADLGSTEHHPHWGVAWKFPPERAATILRAIEVTVGKSGKLTPVGELDPVELAGTTVSRASLHNFVELERRDARLGDVVIVEKAGEIIPQIVGVEASLRRAGVAPFARPVVCPACGGPLRTEEVFLVCAGTACPARARERLRHFASRQAMDIDGLGASIVEQLVTELGVVRPDQLYELDAARLARLPRLAQKSAEKLVMAIAGSKTRGLSRVLHGLALKNVGEALAEALAEHFGDLAPLRAQARAFAAGDRKVLEALAPEDGVGPIAGLGEKTAEALLTELASPEVEIVIEGLLRHGVRTTSSAPPVEKIAGIDGKTFVLTGTLPTLGRDAAEAKIKRAGGKVAGSVSARTHYVVAGAGGGSKLTKATELGVPVLDEAAFLALFGGG